ncbi:MAG: hypothetical protein GXP33_01940 [Spirochaetes bacterium]|nr:hypothetical protein [Spirochaetota bacterium]
MKKKIFILLIVLITALPVLSFAGSGDSKWDSYLKPGNFLVSAGIGFGWGYGLSLAVYPGAELIMAQVKIAGEIPIQFGAAVKGLVNPYGWGSYTGIVLGAGGFGTAHLSFKGLNLPFDYLNRMDFYIGLGVVVNFDTGGYFSYYYNSPLSIGISSYSGVNYFINDNLAVYLEGNYWAYYGGSTVGILLKL